MPSPCSRRSLRRAWASLSASRSASRASPCAPTGSGPSTHGPPRSAFQTGRDSLASRLGALAAPFAAEHEVAPVLELRPAEIERIETALRELTSRPVAAALEMQGTEVVVQPGTPGTTVAVEPLLDSLRAAALAGTGEIVAAVEPVQPGITTEEAEAAAQQARAIVAAPVSIRFKGRDVGALEPSRLAGLTRFARAAGAYEVSLDVGGLERALLPMVKARLRAPVDATFIVGDRVRVVRSRPGTTLAPMKAQEAVLAAALQPGVRTAAVSLTVLPAAFTTKAAKAMGIREKISTFTTDMGESSANRIWNVHLLGDYLNGTIIKSGQTFSYNKEVGPRTADRGFREGQMIFGGVLIPSIGGGVCQTATTVFNAAFEAGLPIKTRYNHSFYISHYPVGRDATVSWGGPDLVFRNDLKNAILVKVSYTNTTFTVSFYGTKQRRRVVATTSTPTKHAAAAPVRDRPVRAAELGAHSGGRRPRLRRQRASHGLPGREGPAGGRLLHPLRPAEPDRDLRPGQAAGAVLLPALERVVR